MKWEDFIGLSSTPTVNVIEAEKVVAFAQALGLQGDRNEHHILRQLPTFPRTFNYGEVPRMKWPSSGLIHAEQSYQYDAPLRIGDVLTCYQQLTDVKRKTGKSGNMTFLYVEQRGLDENKEPRFISKRTLIVPEHVAARGGVQ
ncbi:FAS1-like dehydratase domain-containing protein [Salsuginibacillus kocurii]|uniref:FAS1-like dehydratase domain-containing protein n=1 Tax=Salsuginibacillus kocurii TaxID=427078 RepID=UPI00035E6549|nr:MaoC family dehydratase N-terminal domain-containing protein [Salsuginibacillus kocurii]